MHDKVATVTNDDRVAIAVWIVAAIVALWALCAE